MLAGCGSFKWSRPIISNDLEGTFPSAIKQSGFIDSINDLKCTPQFFISVLEGVRISLLDSSVKGVHRTEFRITDLTLNTAPESLSISSNSLPEGPTNGSPKRYSVLPGASPTKTHVLFDRKFPACRHKIFFPEKPEISHLKHLSISLTVSSPTPRKGN